LGDYEGNIIHKFKKEVSMDRYIIRFITLVWRNKLFLTILVGVLLAKYYPSIFGELASLGAIVWAI
jgi:hypothetical protein